MLAASVHIPLINYRVNRPFDPDDWHFLQEIVIRAWQALLFGLVSFANEDNGKSFISKLEPLLDLLLLPQFPAKISEFFNLNEVRNAFCQVALLHCFPLVEGEADLAVGR